MPNNVDGDAGFGTFCLLRVFAFIAATVALAVAFT
jgi:hypothetical protein